MVATDSSAFVDDCCPLPAGVTAPAADALAELAAGSCPTPVTVPELAAPAFVAFEAAWIPSASTPPRRHTGTDTSATAAPRRKFRNLIALIISSFSPAFSVTLC